MPRISNGKRASVLSESPKSREVDEIVTELLVALHSPGLRSRGNGPAGDVETSCDALLDIAVNGFRVIITREVVAEPEPESEVELLSPREREIARMVAKGYINKTIAAVLDISVWTVGTHLRRVFAKLRVGTRAEMVAKLLENARSGRQV